MSPLVILLPRKKYLQHFGSKIAKIVRSYCHNLDQSEKNIFDFSSSVRRKGDRKERLIIKEIKKSTMGSKLFMKSIIKYLGQEVGPISPKVGRRGKIQSCYDLPSKLWRTLKPA